MSVLAGFLLGIAFDIYRFIRGIFNPERALTNLGDFLFWIFSSIMIFLYFFHWNWAEIRFYYIIVMAVGFLFYMTNFSKHIIVCYIQGKRLTKGILDYANIPVRKIKKIYYKL